MKESIFNDDQNFFKSHQLSENGNLMKSKKEMPIGTISKGLKKVAKGKWVPVKQAARNIKQVDRLNKKYKGTNVRYSAIDGHKVGKVIEITMQGSDPQRQTPIAKIKERDTGKVIQEKVSQLKTMGGMQASGSKLLELN